MKDQIQEILKRENISSSQFADRIGVQRSSVSHVISGRNKPGFEFINKVIDAFPDINASWLITGKGKMYNKITSSTALFDENREEEAQSSKSVTKDQNTAPEPPRQAEPAKPSQDKPEIERIIVFYSDKTFREYQKEP